jgi:hypothetical protein
MLESYQSRCDQSFSTVISQSVAWPGYPTRVMTLNLKTLALGPSLSRTFTAPLGSQRECVVGEFGGSFGEDGAESFPLIF